VLHQRIDHFLSAVGYPQSFVSTSWSVSFRDPLTIDPDTDKALGDRIDAIEQRAPELAALEVERGDDWVRAFRSHLPTRRLRALVTGRRRPCHLSRALG
jgi:hypothetical protein